MFPFPEPRKLVNQVRLSHLVGRLRVSSSHQLPRRLHLQPQMNLGLMYLLT
jgi:hypothetical protein